VEQLLLGGLLLEPAPAAAPQVAPAASSPLAAVSCRQDAGEIVEAPCP
jgi:hypothetical protein